MIPSFFLILAVIFFLLAIFEEKEDYNTDDDVERSHFLVLLYLAFATTFFFISGACMFGVTNTYYSAATDSVVESAPIQIYQYLGWIGIAFGFFCGYLELNKTFDVLGYLNDKSLGSN